jgi:hypothetical protein
MRRQMMILSCAASMSVYVEASGGGSTLERTKELASSTKVRVETKFENS